MARTNTYKCAVCGTTYEFCLKCQVSTPDYDTGKFCNKKHAEIYAILSKHGCNLITADEALKELAAYNLDEIALTEDVQAHVEKIKLEAGDKVKEPVVAKEPEVIEDKNISTTETVKSNKNKKKKW